MSEISSFALIILKNINSKVYLFDPYNAMW